MNHYEVLGVDQNATVTEIKKAYRKKSFALHPDRNQAVTASQEFKHIQDAYECLSDAIKRNTYNQSLLYSGNMDDILVAVRRAQSAAGQGKKVFSAKVTLEEVFTGCKRFVPNENTHVNIPAGVINGSQFSSSNITLVVAIIKHAVFTVDKNDIYTTLYIDAIQAMVGIDLFINHPNGQRLKARIAPATQEGQKIMLAGKGIDSSTYGKGNLYIFCKIVIPVLTQAQQDSIMCLLNSSSAEI
jgi:DnaJ-class molecular chaperone